MASTQAGIVVLVTDRATLGGDDFVAWGVLGPPFTDVTNPFNINSNGGLGMTVSKVSAGPFQRRDKTSGGWGGNFNPDDELIWTNNTPGPMSILFDQTVFGAGAQIQGDAFGDFTATIEAFDINDQSLGSFNLAGTSNGNADNSAIFIGVLSGSSEIKRITFDVDSGDFAINQLDIVTIPAPAAMALLGLGGLLASRRRR